MGNKSPIINIFTYGLPYDLANQMYKEYYDRLKDVNYIISISAKYEELETYGKTVELLLALSIFHKRVVSNLDAAVKFYTTVSRYSTAQTISIGKYDLTGEEKNKMLGVLMSYRNLLEKYEIPEAFMDYYETKEFLIRVLNLKIKFDNAQTQNRKKGGNEGRNIQDDLSI